MFTCPVCGAVSHHPTDAVEGYCGRCHWWTGKRPLEAAARALKDGRRDVRVTPAEAAAELLWVAREARELLGSDVLVGSPRWVEFQARKAALVAWIEARG